MRTAFNPSDISDLYLVSMRVHGASDDLDSPDSADNWIDAGKYEYLHIILSCLTGNAAITVTPISNSTPSATGATEHTDAQLVRSAGVAASAYQSELRCASVGRYVGFKIVGSGSASTPITLTVTAYHGVTSTTTSQTFPTLSSAPIAELGVS